MHLIPSIVWFRRDLRLRDNPALQSAAALGAPIIPLFILDKTPGIRPIGAASRWWLHHSLTSHAMALAELGAPLVLRRGQAAHIIKNLVVETGAARIF